MKIKFTFIALVIGVVYAIASVVTFFTNPNLLLSAELTNPFTIIMYPALFLGVLPSWLIFGSFDCPQMNCLVATAYATPFMTIILFSIIGFLIDLVFNKFFRK